MISGFDLSGLEKKDELTDAPPTATQPSYVFDGLEKVEQEPTGAPFKYADVEKYLPEDKELRSKVKDSLILAATHDRSPSEMFGMVDRFRKEYGEVSLADKVAGSMTAGVGDFYTSVASAGDRVGIKGMGAYKDFGENLKKAYIPPVMDEPFSGRQLLNPDWWATTVARSVPSTLALLPAAIIGAYTTSGLAMSAGIAEAGTLLNVILGSMGATALSRPIESAMEAGGSREEALAAGMSEEKANQVFDEVYANNLKLAGLDVAELTLAFLPMRIPGKNATKILRKRAFSAFWPESLSKAETIAKRGLTKNSVLAARGLPGVFTGSANKEAVLAARAISEPFLESGLGKVVKTGAKLGGVGLMENAEERYQTKVQLDAMGDNVDFFANDPRLNEAGTIGSIFGLGMGTAGSVWTSFTSSVAETMPDDMRKKFDSFMNNSPEETKEGKELDALNKIAKTPEGQAHIEDVMDYLQNPPDSKPEIKIIGVNEDDNGEPTSYVMMDRDTGDTFEVPVNATPQEIEFARSGDELDQIITGRQEVDNLIGADYAVGKPIAPTDLINGITRAAAGDMMAAGDERVLQHIREGIDKYGVKAMEDAIRNQEITEVVEVPKSERAAVRERIAKLRPEIDAILAEGESPLFSKKTADPELGAMPITQEDADAILAKFNEDHGTDIIYQGPWLDSNGEVLFHTVTDRKKDGPTQRSTMGVTGEFTYETLKEAHDRKAELFAANPSLARSEHLPGALVKGMSVKAVQAKIDAITKGWAKSVVATEFNKLPLHLRNYIIEKGAVTDVQGVYDPKTNKVYFVANNIRKGDDLNKIALHELVGHFGFENIVESGGFTMPEIVAEVQRLKEEGNATILKAATEVSALYKEYPGEVVESKEIIAHLAQKGSTMKLIKRIVAAIKQGLRNLTNGKLFKQLTDSDLMYMIQQASDFVQKGKAVATGYVDLPATMSKQSPIWYSRLTNLLIEQPVNKQPATAWLATLNSWKKKGKISPALQEELEWSGMEDALKLAGKEKLTKLDLLEMIEKGGVTVEETILGSDYDSFPELKAFNRLNYLLRENDNLGFNTSIEARAAIREYDTDWVRRWDIYDPELIELGSDYATYHKQIKERYTQYASRVLPGGTNYKELLITLPQRLTSLNEDTQKIFKKDFIDLTDEELRLFNSRTNDTDYTPPHFSSYKNLLVHVRFDERTDTEGNRVLFINEIQSDWAKGARKQGIRGQAQPVRQYGVSIGGAEPNIFFNTREEAVQRSIEITPNFSEPITVVPVDRVATEGISDAGVPNAPFIKSTNAATMLGFKRALKYAVDNGFDKIAWPSEAQQVYDVEGWGEVQENDLYEVEVRKNGEWTNLQSEGLFPYDTEEEARETSDLIMGDIAAGDSDATEVRIVKVKSDIGKGSYLANGQDVSAIVNRYIKVLPSMVNDFLKKQMGSDVQTDKSDIGLGTDERVPGVAAGIELYNQGRDLFIGTFPIEERLTDASELDVRNVIRDAFIAGEDVTVVVESQPINSLSLAPIAEKVSSEGVPLFSKVKANIRQATGQQKDNTPTISERKALEASFRKAAQAARTAHRAGKFEERDIQKAIMKEKLEEIRLRSDIKVDKIKTNKEILQRRRQMINDIKKFFNLTDNDLKKINKKDIRLMSNYEFKQFKDDIAIKSAELAENKFAKAVLMKTIFDKRLEKVDNYRRVLELPAIDKMTTEQLTEFDSILQQFEEGDVFLTTRELEVVDRTDLEGIKTWREARARLAQEAGVSIDDLTNIKVAELDNFRWDAVLAERNPFYWLLVNEVTRRMLVAQKASHDIETEVFALAKKSDASRNLSFVDKAIPQDKQILEYLEASSADKNAIADSMTPEQLDYAHYIQEYFGNALEYLLQTSALQKGRENYFVHIRRSFLETVKEDGLLTAVKELFKNYEQDQMTFSILDGDTGNILPLEKFFQYSLQRTGELTPTKNITRAFMTYVVTLEKKRALDAILPKMDIYAKSLTPAIYTERGLEVDRSLKKFVNKYLNNKKGRRLGFDSVIKQGGKIDIAISAMRAFTTLLDLGLNIPVGLASFVGEQTASFAMMGTTMYAKGVKRLATKKGMRIAEKYEMFTGRSLWEEFTAPGRELTNKLHTGLFGLFHLSSRTANRQFLLGNMTDQEWKNEELTPERIADLQLEMGRMRKVPGTESLVGSTSTGKAMIQYKSWAVPIMRTLTNDIKVIVSDLRAKPLGEALTSKEAREIFRTINLVSAVVIVGGLSGDKKDDSFMGQLKAKLYREAMTLMQGLDPKLWLMTPRIYSFMEDLGINLHSLLVLEEYKTKPRKGQLKGIKKLKTQFTPRFFKTFQSEKKKVTKLNKAA